jgi:tRNA threonylcarbamoyl adenosine modification protein YeaZ
MIAAALDTSCGTSLAIVRDGHLVLEAQLALEGRGNDRELVPWLMTELARAGTTPGEVRQWTAGTGPGSFSGIRVGIAWIQGVCLASGADYRGIPSSLAIAMELFHRQPQARTAGIFHDGRRRQVILTRFESQADGIRQIGEPEPLDPAEAEMALAKLDIAGTVQAPLVLPLFSLDSQSRITALPAIPARRLLEIPGPFPATPADQEASCEPVYVRPPVFVEPKPARPDPIHA